MAQWRLLGGCAATAAMAIGFLGLSRDKKVPECDEERWQRLRLMSPVEASMTKSATVSSFLSRSEALQLQDAIQSLQKTYNLGMAQRDANGRPVEDSGSVAKRSTVWTTTYLHSNGVFGAEMGALRQKIRDAMEKVDEESGWRVLRGRKPEDLHFRTVEFHEYQCGGQLANWRDEHFDDGSLITCDIMLADPGQDFTGGELVMPESDGTVFEPSFGQGDAVFFLSHKYHNVRPVRDGRRAVLVVELWDGPERTCAHRCVRNSGECHQSVSRYELGNLAKDFANLC